MKISGLNRVQTISTQPQRWSESAVQHFSIILCLSLVLSLFTAPGTAFADSNPAPVQLFYVTLPETDGLAVLDAINTAADLTDVHLFLHRGRRHGYLCLL